MKICIIIVLIICSIMCFAKPNSNRAEWISNGNYGLGVHFLITPEGNTDKEKIESFNKIVDNFDLKTFMKQFDASGADWLIFTIGQNNGYYNSSNKTIDRIMPNRTSKRDLVLEIAKEVKKRNKHFIAYLPGEFTAQSYEMKTAFKWNDERVDFVKIWADVLRDYSLKYGKYCDGWWIDGCFPHVTFGKYDWKLWADAMRAGNPNSAIAISAAAFTGNVYVTGIKENDYFPGEVSVVEDGFIRTDLLSNNVILTEDNKVRTKNVLPGFFVPREKYLDNSILHAFVPLDCSFNSNVKGDWLHYDVKDMIKLTHSFSDVGGGITLNVPVDINGRIPQDSVNKLILIGKSYKNKKAKYPLDMKVLERSVYKYGENPNPKNKAFGKPCKLMDITATKVAEASSNAYHAYLGNDGNYDSYAIAAWYWDWTYFLDLKKDTPINEIKVYMEKEGYSTDFAISISEDNINWTTVMAEKNPDGLTEFSCKDINKIARYVRVQSFAPNGPNQKGGQMVIREVEVY